jgi:hypothetical protein
MPNHVAALYQDAIDNIVFLKRQQWAIINYALLVYAAIYVLQNHDGCWPFLSYVVLPSTAVVSVILLLTLEYSIRRKFRHRIGVIYETFHPKGVGELRPWLCPKAVR